MYYLIFLLAVSFSVHCTGEGAEDDYQLLISSNIDHFIMLQLNQKHKIKQKGHLTYQYKDTQIKSIATDYERKQVFLMRNSLSAIQVLENYAHSEYSHTKTLHTGLSQTNGEIAVDWVTGNVYWTDAWLNCIMMQPSDTNSTSNKNLPVVHTNINTPCSLTLDPWAGFLFWGDCGDTPLIERSTLAGEDRVILANQSILSPNSMKADNNGKLYWVDRKRHTVEVMTYSGQDRKVLLQLSRRDLTSITIYKDMLLVVDHSNNEVIYYDKQTGSYRLTISLPTNSHPWAVDVFHKATQPIPRKSACSSSYKCEDMCALTPGGRQCLCRSGSTLMADKRGCQSANSKFEMKAIVTDGKLICGLDLRLIPSSFLTGDVLCPLKVSSNVSHFAADTKTGNLFIAIFNSLYDLVVNERKTILLRPLTENIGDMKFDPVDRILYLTQPNVGKIMALKLDNRMLIPLVRRRKQPTYLALDVHGRSIYWIEKTDGAWAIYTSDIDGQNISELPSNNFSNPGHLAYYAPHNILFLIDDGKIKSVNLTAYTINNALREVKPGAVSLTVYKDYLLWIEPEKTKTSFLTMSIVTGEIISNTKLRKRFHDLVIFDRTDQSAVPDPCSRNNCEHICLSKETTAQCGCDFGYTLVENTKCVSGIKEEGDFFLVADLTHLAVYQIDMKSKNVQALKPFRHKNASSLAYDGINKQVFIRDETTGNIYIEKLISESRGRQMFIYPDGFNSLRNLVVDEISGNVYFSIYDFKKRGMYIGVMKNRKFRVLIDSGRTNVLGIAVSSGMIFWTNETAVYSAYGDGSGAKLIVRPKSGFVPMQITVDKKKRHIFWVEHKSSSWYSVVMSANLNGKDRKDRAIAPNINTLAINVHEDFLYYTASSSLGIKKLKLPGEESSIFVQEPEFGQFGSFVMHINGSQSGSERHPCSINNGGCDTFCLPRGDQYVCACDRNSNLIGDKSCDKFCDDSIPHGEFNEDCSLMKGETCGFICYEELSKSYNPSLVVPEVTCGGDGQWSFPVDKLCVGKKTMCPDNFSKGSLDAPCDNSDKGTCSFTCSPGYSSDLTSITCVSGVWNHDIDELCQSPDKKTMCPDNFSKGSLDAPCDNSDKGTCSFICSPGYSSDLTSITCVSGVWNHDIDELCQSPANRVQIKSTHVTVGVQAGIGVGVVLFIIIAAVAGFFLWKKFRPKREDLAVRFVKEDLPKTGY